MLQKWFIDFINDNKNIHFLGYPWTYKSILPRRKGYLKDLSYLKCKVREEEKSKKYYPAFIC